MTGVPSLSSRSAGVLLHPTSLPSPHGIGDFGVDAVRFLDWLASAGARWWQMLPLVPPAGGNSPYTSGSAFAGNPLLLDLAQLEDEGLLASASLRSPPGDPDRTDYAAVRAFKTPLLREAYRAWRSAPEPPDMADFRAAARDWLDDYTLFSALRSEHGGRSWTRWPSGERNREPGALHRARERLRRRIGFHEFLQHRFWRQWQALRKEAHARGLGLIGDLPIFVAHDSADVWAHREDFKLDERGRPTGVAGVPPDYFSRTGQLWGNPLYDWARMRRRGYAWWIARLRNVLARFDVVRLDHFIGFVRYWEVPPRDRTALRGRWMKGPGLDFFNAVQTALGGLPLIAEDLGAVTPAVHRLRDRLGLPGMVVLQFSFGAGGPRLDPSTLPKRCVLYTGTHDNDTTMGWWESRRGNEEARSAAEAIRRYVPDADPEPHWNFVRLALSTPASTVIIPMQDLLGLGTSARMNIPGRARGNWRWRVRADALSPALADRLRALLTAERRI